LQGSVVKIRAQLKEAALRSKLQLSFDSISRASHYPAAKDHFMSRPDPLLSLLKDTGFLPLRLPRADVKPTQLLNLDGQKFSLLGDLDEAMNAGTAKLHAIKTDVATARQIQARAPTVKLSLGVDTLGNILGALTTPI
jgi:hypothetical protein